MSGVRSLENLKSVFVSKFGQELSVNLVQLGPKPLLVIHRLKPTDLTSVPSFHVVARTSNVDTKFVVQLLSFHGRVLVRPLSGWGNGCSLAAKE